LTSYRNQKILTDVKKRVALFMHGGISGGINGQGFPLITQIVNALAKNFDVTVFSLSSFSEGFQPEKYKAFCVPREIQPSIFRWLYLISLFLKSHKVERYNILYSFWGYPMGTFMVGLGKITGKPTVVNILGAESANVPEINYGHLKKKFSRMLVVWTCQQASELIAVSANQLKLLKPYGVTRHAEIIPWGVSKNLFRPFNPNLDLPLKIIHVANLTAVKDQTTLLKAFKLINEKIPATLKIVGPDFMNGQIQRLAFELGLDGAVEFVGFVPHQKVAEYYYWADVFMLTSLAEGQNNSITEAMMCGALPVSTSVGIMDDLGNTVGIVERPGDYQNLARQLISLYNAPEEWRKRLQAAQKWAQAHDLDWTIKQLKDVLNRY
jgi:glycosyltransferase involved in cell wall biosynthesis